MSGEDLFKKAEKQVNKMFFNDYDEAFELFNQSGGVFKSEKNWTRAGEAFSRAADMAMKLKNHGDAANAFTESANAFKKVNLDRANVSMKMAVELNIQNNRLPAAARLLKDWGDAVASEGRALDAVPHYRKAFDYYSAENQKQSAMGCLTAMAKVLGEADKWDEAAKVYEQIGKAYVDGPLKHQAKEQFFRALLLRCALVEPDNRMEKSQEAMESWQDYLATDMYLRNSREAEFAEILLSAVEDGDEGQFDEFVSKMDELRMIDDWKAHVLSVIKKKLDSTI